MEDSIIFDGVTYPSRILEIEGFGERTIAGESLERVLFDEDDEYVSRTAEAIDEHVFFFIDDKLLETADNETLAKAVEREVA